MNSLLYKINILSSYLKTKNYIKKADRFDFESYQKKKLAKIIKFAQENSEYYKKSLQGITLDNFDRAPVINKSIMMENFNAINTVGIDRDEALRVAIESERSRDFSPMINDITVGLSSGTSGHRGLFIASVNERAQYAGNIIAKLIPGSIFSTHRIGYFLRSDSNLYQAGKSKNIKFMYFDLVDSIELNVKKLNEFQPTLLLAPPSVLKKLVLQKNLNHLKIMPQKIVSIAEILEKKDKAIIEQAFEQKLHEIYQCTEGFLGATCEHGNLHLNEDLIYVEKKFVNNEKTKFVPIITDFNRHSQPYIRYELNDILNIEKEACPCQSPHTRISSIEGRSDDIFYFKSQSNKMVSVYPDFIRRTILFSSDLVHEYQVIQKSPTELLVNLELDRSQDEVQKRIRDEFKKLAEEFSFEVPSVVFQSSIEKIGSNKLRRIKREFTVEVSLE